MTLSGSGTDAGAADAGARDAGAVDAGAVDAGGRDGGAGGGVDGGADAGVPRSDAGADAGPARDGGCTLAFAPVTRQPGGGSFLVSSDFDRDGRPDLAWTNPFADELGVVLNSMTGLQPVVRTRFAAGAWPSALAVADVDLDGFDDLVVGAFFASQLVLARNNQQGRFSLSTRYQVPNVWAVSAAPLDAVPGRELVVSNELTDVLVLRNVAGALALPNPWATDAGLGVYGNCVGDLRGGGVDDVVALSGLGPGLATVLRNDGNARFFTTGEQLTMTGRPTACLIGDLDADGAAELIVTTLDSTLEIFQGTGGGRLVWLATLPGLKSENAPALGDLDLDGRPELIIASSVADGGVFLVRALLDGGLSAPTRVTSLTPASVVVIDVDADGLPDVAGVAGGETFVLRNQCR